MKDPLEKAETSTNEAPAFCMELKMDEKRQRRLERQKEYNRNRRNKKHAFYYTQAWKDARAAYREKHPVCEMCGRAPSVIVDHIVELNDGGDPFDERNFQALCIACHNKKTAKEKWERTVRTSDGDVLVLTEDAWRNWQDEMKRFSGEEVIENAKSGKFATDIKPE